MDIHRLAYGSHLALPIQDNECYTDTNMIRTTNNSNSDTYHTGEGRQSSRVDSVTRRFRRSLCSLFQP